MTARRRKKSPSRRKAPKTPRRRKAAAKKRGRKPARKKARKKAAKKKPARKKVRKSAAATPESLARKIVKATQGDPANVSFSEFYADDAVSHETAGEPARGLAAIQAKAEMWEQMQDSRAARWKAVNVFTRPGSICIEWEADLRMRDGRAVTFREIAVHELRKGKIVSERYYYDPSSLAPPAA